MPDEPRPFAVPVLETPRTVMRPHNVEDFEDVAAMWADPDVVRHISGRPSTREESWSRLLRYIGHWTALQYGFWAVEDRQSGRYLGDVGLADFKRDIQPPPESRAEAGWVLRPETHGRGLATETVAAALNWADANLASERTTCLIAPDNRASIRVAEKVGFRQVAQVVHRDEPTLVFHRQRQPSKR